MSNILQGTRPIVNKEARILIVGAGPSGLTLALELKRYGFSSVRVVEKLEQLTTRGRALAIIPKTLDYLHASGATELILAKAQQVTRVQLYKHGKVQEFQLSGIHKRYDHMTTLEQEDIERCLIERLEAYGGAVDRGIELISLKPKERVAVLKQGEDKESYHYDLLIGADGVGSTVRQLMGFAFKGHEEADAWEQMEVQVKKQAENDSPLMLFLDGQPILGAIPAPKNTYRVVTPTIGVEERFETLQQRYSNLQIEKVFWKSRFRVGYRSSVEMFEDQVIVIGDAANVHSPVGGRGMNKGIEDAYTLAKALASGTQLNTWERQRKHTDRFIVSRVRLASWVIQREGLLGKLLSTCIFRFPVGFKTFIVNSVLK